MSEDTFDATNPDEVAAAYHRERAAREKAERERDEARAEVERLRELVREALGLADIYADESKARESTILYNEIHRIRVDAGLGPAMEALGE